MIGRAFLMANRVGSGVAGWWRERSPREQWLLGLSAALFALWLLTTLVITPLQSARAAARADIQTYETLSARLRRSGPLMSGAAAVKGPPATILASSAAPFGIAPAIVGEGAEVRVTVADASYDALLRWIAAFEQSSRLRVARMRLDSRPVSGMVSAELLVRT